MVTSNVSLLKNSRSIVYIVNMYQVFLKFKKYFQFLNKLYERLLYLIFLQNIFNKIILL